MESIQEDLDEEIDEIYYKYLLLVDTHRGGVFASLQAFEAVRQGLETEAKEVKAWLDLEAPTLENVSVLFD